MASIKIIDRGFEKQVKLPRSLAGAQITVGVHSDVSGDMALIASANEFGTVTRTHNLGTDETGTEQHIPARSFMRSTIDERQEEIGKVVEVVSRDVMLGKLRLRQGLGVIGEWVQGAIVKKIDSNIPPPNAPSTIEQKGSSHTLIDSGRLKQSLRYKVKMDQKAEE